MAGRPVYLGSIDLELWWSVSEDHLYNNNIGQTQERGPIQYNTIRNMLYNINERIKEWQGFTVRVKYRISNGGSVCVWQLMVVTESCVTLALHYRTDRHTDGRTTIACRATEQASTCKLHGDYTLIYKHHDCNVTPTSPIILIINVAVSDLNTNVLILSHVICIVYIFVPITTTTINTLFTNKSIELSKKSRVSLGF